MKTILILIAIIISGNNFAQTNDSLIKRYYSSGQLKSTGRLTSKGLKDGEFIYYSKEGKIDSSITFKNGRLDGLKVIYYSPDDIFNFSYQNNQLQSHTIYDSTNHLKYKSPLNIDNIPKTTFHFTSGRNFYKSGSTDTLLINHDVPFLNQNIYFPGATVRSIDKYSWQISRWDPQPGTSKGKMVIDISQFTIDGFPETASIKSKALRHEVILIPIE